MVGGVEIPHPLYSFLLCTIINNKIHIQMYTKFHEFIKKNICTEARFLYCAIHFLNFLFNIYKHILSVIY